MRAVADRGYYKGEDIAACERDGITPYVAHSRHGIAASNGHFPKDRFHYDAGEDIYRCPGGQTLDTRYRSVAEGHVWVEYSNPKACAACALKAQCTNARYRRVHRWENEAILDRMAERLASRPEILGLRRDTVEHPFGSIKQWMNQGAFLMRGLDKVRAEFSLTALAYNLRRAITLIGVPGLIRAVQA